MALKKLFNDTNCLEEYAKLVVKYPKYTNMVNKEIVNSALLGIEELDNPKTSYFLGFLKYMDCSDNIKNESSINNLKNKMIMSIVGLSFIRANWEETKKLSYSELSLLSMYSSHLTLENSIQEQKRIGKEILETIVTGEPDIGFQAFLLTYAQSMIGKESKETINKKLKTHEKKQLYMDAFNYASQLVEEVGKYL